MPFYFVFLFSAFKRDGRLRTFYSSWWSGFYSAIGSDTADRSSQASPSDINGSVFGRPQQENWKRRNGADISRGIWCLFGEAVPLHSQVIIAAFYFFFILKDQRLIKFDSWHFQLCASAHHSVLEGHPPPDNLPHSKFRCEKSSAQLSLLFGPVCRQCQRCFYRPNIHRHSFPLEQRRNCRVREKKHFINFVLTVVLICF